MTRRINGKFIWKAFYGNIDRKFFFITKSLNYNFLRRPSSEDLWCCKDISAYGIETNKKRLVDFLLLFVIHLCTHW